MQDVIAQPPNLFKLLAHDIRWKLLTLLGRSDYCVQDLVRLVAQPQNLVSYHLQQLRKHGIVTERRSAADERSFYYSINLEHLQIAYIAAAGALHPGLVIGPSPTLQWQHAWLNPPRVLFLCTENSARSQMAEALLRHLSRGQVEAYSAGIHPTSVHPEAIQAMESVGIDISQYRAKHVDTFRDDHCDCIITVCDKVRECCPTFPGDPEQIHWSVADPTSADESQGERSLAFAHTATQLSTRIHFLLALLEKEKGVTRETSRLDPLYRQFSPLSDG